MDKKIDFLDEMANFIFTSKYARYDEKHHRRETWLETVKRVEKMHLKKYSFLSEKDQDEIRWAFDQVREKYVVPSMRSMQFGGKAVEQHNTRLFNCAVRHIDSIRSFAEIFYLLMNGVGVGIGVSHKFLNRLPNFVDKYDKNNTVVTYVVQDSIEGWADTIEALLNCYFKNTAFTGRKIVFDFSRVRPKGAPIKTGGGKAPGPEGLQQSLERIKALLDYLIEHNRQTRIEPINAYDIIMHLSDAVLSGGIRRAATICIFEKTDDQMMHAKSNLHVLKCIGFEKDVNKKGDTIWEGRVIIDTTKKYGGFENKKYDVTLTDYEYELLKKKKEISWYHIEPQRARSNNSILLMRKDLELNDFRKVIEKIKQYGEPGFIFADDEKFLVNPCAEASFIPVTEDGVCGVQFCNLVTMNGKQITSKEKFKHAAKAATILGTLQAGYTEFNYLTNTTKILTEREALLGVSITGLMENPDILLNPDIQKEMAQYCVSVNKDWAKKININQAARISLIKPEGTSSLLFGTSSGIHPHHAYKYFRRIQCNKEDNIYKHFKQYNPHATEESVWSATNTDDVVTFPVTVSEKAIVKKDLTAIKHLKYILSTQRNWVLNGESPTNNKNIHHNISCTVIVADDEWEDVIKFIYDNCEHFTAVSFMPKTGDKLYKQTPMEEVVTEEELKKFNDLMSKWNKVDYTKLIENDDITELQKEIACTGGVCEIVSTKG